MSIDTDTTGDKPKRPKMAQGEKEARARQAAQSKSRSADSPSNWRPWSLETHLERGQMDMVVNGTLPLPLSPRPSSNFPIIRDVHGPLEQLDRIVSDLEQTGVIDHEALLRMAEIFSLIDRSDRTPPTWGDARRMIARVCRALGQSEPEEPDEQQLIDMGYRRDDDDGEGEEEKKPPLPPMTIGPESWSEKWDPKDATEAGQGVIDL